MNEIWKDIKGYEGLYQVSNLGNVRSVDRIVLRNGIQVPRKGKILNQIKFGDYLTVHLSKNGIKKHFRIHRLVAEAFLSNPDNLPIVNHKDYNVFNNNVDNLEWCSYKYNNNYGSRNQKLSNTRTGKSAYIKVIQTSLTGDFIKEWSSVKEITDTTGYSYGYLLMVLSGKYESAYGYKWLKKAA